MISYKDFFHVHSIQKFGFKKESLITIETLYHYTSGGPLYRVWYWSDFFTGCRVMNVEGNSVVSNFERQKIVGIKCAECGKEIKKSPAKTTAGDE